MNAAAYTDGYKAGLADRLLGVRNQYAYWGIIDPLGSYPYLFSIGYRAAWRR